MKTIKTARYINAQLFDKRIEDVDEYVRSGFSIGLAIKIVYPDVPLEIRERIKQEMLNRQRGEIK
ncbi:hypothetical protein LCGC14_0967660 [marine sediment metagenome]|uniref:Uncharacterized protein n=1 Tax=marine sediment metagenome TaxID=412755 RepID=A0A0F9NCR4_9ZZZZ